MVSKKQKTSERIKFKMKSFYLSLFIFLDLFLRIYLFEEIWLYKNSWRRSFSKYRFAIEHSLSVNSIKCCTFSFEEFLENKVNPLNKIFPGSYQGGGGEVVFYENSINPPYDLYKTPLESCESYCNCYLTDLKYHTH